MQIKKTIPASLTDQELLIDIPDPVVSVSVTGGTPIPEPNKPPQVSVQSVGKIQLPQTEVLLQGSASDLDGHLVSYLWKQLSGPVVTLSNGDQLVGKISDLKPGDYVFEFAATDDDGAVSKVSVSFTILAEVPPVVTPAVKSFPIDVTQRTDEYVRPNCGMETWNGSYGVKTNSGSATGTIRYKRFSYFDIRNNDGTFTWSIFDSEIKIAIQNKQKFSFGIMNLYPGAGTSVDGYPLSYPLFVHKLMQAESVKDWTYSSPEGWKAWIPNCNSENYISEWQKTLQGVADHIIANGWQNVIGYVDIRGYGSCGEWHTWDWTGKEPAGTKATAASLKRMVDIHLKCFPNYPAVALMGAFDQGGASKVPAEVSTYILSTKNAWGDIGWRRDNWGDAGYDSTLDKYPELLTRYKTAYVTGEPLNDKVAVSRNCGAAYCDLVREVKKYHLNSLGNANFPGIDTATQTNIKSSEKEMGYRIGITGGSVDIDTVNKKVKFTVNWINIGGNPPLDQWSVFFEIGSAVYKSKFSPLLFVGAKTFVEEMDYWPLPSGDYQLKIYTADPTGFQRPLPINTIVDCKITL